MSLPATDVRACLNCERTGVSFAATDKLPWGLAGWCDDCFKIKRQWAWTIFKRAVRVGDVQRPQLCSDCGKPNASGDPITGHHLNYHHPLGVVWLCSTCHSRAHRVEERRVRALRNG